MSCNDFNEARPGFSRPPVFVIWADAKVDGPLAGQSGYLSERKTPLLFNDKMQADQKIRDLQNLCVRCTSVVTYRRDTFTGDTLPDTLMAVETIKEHDLKPDFAPEEYILKDKICGNTGGGCMVGTVSFYLPSLDKTVWVNCNDEGVTVTSADHVWNSDDSGSWGRYEDVLLLEADFRNTDPQKLEAWLPMVKEALSYTVDWLINNRGMDVQLPPQWLPKSYQQKASPTYIAWALENNVKVTITSGGEIKIDKRYAAGTQEPSPGPAMTSPC